jgi:hypothetical protein
MLDSLKKLFGGKGDSSGKAVPGRRVAPKGESAVLLEGRRYQLRNWNTEGFLFGPYTGDLAAGRRVKVELVVMDGEFKLKCPAVATITRVDGAGVDAKFYFISPEHKKQIQAYVAHYS